MMIQVCSWLVLRSPFADERICTDILSSFSMILAGATMVTRNKYVFESHTLASLTPILQTTRVAVGCRFSSGLGEPASSEDKGGRCGHWTHTVSSYEFNATSLLTWH